MNRRDSDDRFPLSAREIAIWIVLVALLVGGFVWLLYSADDDRWTAAQAYAMLITVLGVAMTIRLTKWLLDASREAVIVAKHDAESARDTATKQAAAAELTAELAIRPIIELYAWSDEWTAANKRVAYAYKNLGPAPAFNLRWRVAIASTHKWFSPHDSETTAPKLQRVSCSPRDVEAKDAFVPNEATPRDLVLIAEYDDILGQPWYSALALDVGKDWRPVNGPFQTGRSPIPDMVITAVQQGVSKRRSDRDAIS